MRLVLICQYNFGYIFQPAYHLPFCYFRRTSEMSLADLIEVFRITNNLISSLRPRYSVTYGNTDWPLPRSRIWLSGMLKSPAVVFDYTVHSQRAVPIWSHSHMPVLKLSGAVGRVHDRDESVCSKLTSYPVSSGEWKYYCEKISNVHFRFFFEVYFLF